MIFLFSLLVVTSTFATSVDHERREKRGSSTTDRIFEGDMLLTEEQIQAAENGMDPNNVSGARGLSKSRKWPNGIVPYTLDSSAGMIWKRAAISSAIREWEEKTCIKFVKRTTEKAYIEFFVGKGCYSSVGMTGRRQRISLGYGCGFHGIVVHEIGHALGFFHEQSRPDRDNYVYILWSNIQQGKTLNFRKYSHGSIDSLGVSYDYNSIMHYGEHEFANWPWQVTIKARNGASIGQRRHLSPKDVKQMNLFYECDKK